MRKLGVQPFGMVDSVVGVGLSKYLDAKPILRYNSTLNAVICVVVFTMTFIGTLVMVTFLSDTDFLGFFAQELR
jgi:hypothetical protein